MGNLKFGTNSPLALYMGVSGSTKAYYGTTEVFSGGGTDYSKEYLTFEILTGGTIIWKINGTDASKSKTISYSKNGGEWTDLASTTGDGTSFNVDAGDVVRFKGDTLGTGNGITDSGGYSFFSGSTAYFNVYGNLLSIASSTGYTSAVTLTNSFKALFKATHVISADNLVLPPISVTFQFRSLFESCTFLRVAPPLLSPTTTTNCYHEMFKNCFALNNIKCLATNIAGSGNTLATYYWLQGASSTGTFTKDPNMTSWPAGLSGIPSGWTVVDAS